MKQDSRTVPILEPLVTSSGESFPCAEKPENHPTKSQTAALLNQQIWCWGRDIEHDAGNLLVQYGFQRIEKPALSEAASLYRLELSRSVRVIVRGFGVFWGNDDWGGLFLHRYDFRPHLTPEPDLYRPAWLSADLPPLCLPCASEMLRCQQLLVALVNWIAEYETWIADRCGINYRRETVSNLVAKKKMTVPAELQAQAWRQLGAAIAAHPQQYIVSRRRS